MALTRSRFCSSVLKERGNCNLGPRQGAEIQAICKHELAIWRAWRCAWASHNSLWRFVTAPFLSHFSPSAPPCARPSSFFSQETIQWPTDRRVCHYFEYRKIRKSTRMDFARNLRMISRLYKIQPLCTLEIFRFSFVPFVIEFHVWDVEKEFHNKWEATVRLAVYFLNDLLAALLTIWLVCVYKYNIL